MSDIFASEVGCPVCGTNYCLHAPPPPPPLIPHVREKFKQPHVLATEQIWSAPTETGIRQMVYGIGDPIPLHVAVALGLPVPEGAKPAVKGRRAAPAPRLVE